MTRLITLTASAALISGVASAQERTGTTIYMVGSSTVFPFSEYVMDKFASETGYDRPTNFSTGTGGGNKIFCKGIGAEHPDLSGASSRWNEKRFVQCDAGGIPRQEDGGYTEMNIGFDGITLFNSVDEAPLEFDRAGLALALTTVDASECGYEGEVPNITVLGPPESSGTRAAFAELVIEAGFEEAGCPEEIVDSFADVFDVGGAYIEGGENDSAMVDEVAETAGLIGIAGYSFLSNNLDQIQGAVVEGVSPTFENIASGDYPVSRRLWFYVKNAHLDVIPGLRDFVNFYMEDRFIGDEGELISVGLIPLPASERAAEQAQAASL
ncbi:MAG: substrate-binding domain-containing protein [Alphaproteobacteria bacterium]